LASLYKSLDKAKGKWLERLPEVLWPYQTTKHVPTSETPFSMAYGTEAIIPVDVYMPTLWTERVGWDQNIAQLRLPQDQSEDRR